jgi:putative Mn2+ efflux pump MntP
VAHDVMDWWLLLGIAVGLAMDAFAAAIAISVSLGRVSGRQTFRLAWHFGLFQALMPIIGWYGGVSVERWISGWDHWLAFGLLAFVGGRMLASGLRRGREEFSRLDPTRGIPLVVLSVATSIDALAVGLSFAALGVRIWIPSAVIGLTAALLTVVGTALGSRLGDRFGRWMEVLGGALLIAIGARIVVAHLTGG